MDMNFNEANTVEQMILDTVANAGGNGPLFALGGLQSTIAHPSREAGWDLVPAVGLPRQVGDVMVEPWVRDALIRLNPEITDQPDRADEVIYNLPACILPVRRDGLVRADENFMAWFRGEKSTPFGPHRAHGA